MILKKLMFSPCITKRSDSRISAADVSNVLPFSIPGKITEWIDDPAGTAVCPYCGMDSVIGESSGYPITRKFLQRMQKYYF